LQVISDAEEDAGELSRESIWDLSCETVREQLTNSIRKQWRILKSHVEKLDNQVSKVHLEGFNDEDVISRQDHEQETEKLELEIQQCKEMIKTQQQLLQQQLATACDDDTTSLLRDCYLLEEKERLKEEWSLFKEQKKNFEKERRSFTDAAIRLGLEVFSTSSFPCRAFESSGRPSGMHPSSAFHRFLAVQFVFLSSSLPVILQIT